jgi:hypothetical protein
MAVANAEVIAERGVHMGLSHTWMARIPVAYLEKK